MNVREAQALGTPTKDTRSATLGLSSIATAAGILCLVSVLANLTPDTHRPAVIALSALAVGFGGVIAVTGRRLSARFFPLAGMPLAIAQLSVGIAVSGDPENPAQILYVVAVIYSCFFFSRRAALAQVGLVAVGFALALVPIADFATALDRWMFALGVALPAGVATVVVRDRLVAQSRIDWLTGLANRLAFQERLQEEWTRTTRGGPAFALVLVDVDGFKAINDEHGHPAGDAALERVARALRRAVRSHDLVARIGGDEFALILVGQASSVSPRLRERIAADLAEGDPPVRVSLGKASAAEAASADAVLKRADEALYRAKRAGGDRTPAAAAI